VLYGDKNNWFATYTFWLCKLYGVERVRVLDGGRGKWIAEGRPLVRDASSYPQTVFRAKSPDLSIRAFRDQVLERLGKPGVALVDVRSPQEYSGELIAMPAYPQEGAQRGGHIPSAQSIPWSQNVRENGTFKPVEELRQLYEGQGVHPDNEVIAYCRIGERSSLTLFTLRKIRIGGRAMRRNMRMALIVAAVVGVAWLLAAASIQRAPAAGAKPSDGWTLHITAKMHFPGKPAMLAHHFCKTVSGGLTECQLYDSGAPDARLVGVEMIVDPATYAKFSEAEKALWHYHRVEIPLVAATLLDMSPEEAAKVLNHIEDTYGKIYLLWDPALQTLPTGRPSITVLPKPK